MREFSALSAPYSAGIFKTVFPVKADREMPRDDPGLAGTTVAIDGKPYRVITVGRKLPAYPIRQGEIIELVVEELKTVVVLDIQGEQNASGQPDR